MEVNQKCTAKVGYKKLYAEFTFGKHEYEWNKGTDKLELLRAKEYEGQTEV